MRKKAADADAELPDVLLPDLEPELSREARPDAATTSSGYPSRSKLAMLVSTLHVSNGQLGPFLARHVSKQIM
jgi:hypothetical protein